MSSSSDPARRGDLWPFNGLRAPMEQLILGDQLQALRRSVLVSLPVHALAGVIVLLVSLHHGRTRAGLIWLALLILAKLLRAITSQPASVLTLLRHRAFGRANAEDREDGLEEDGQVERGLRLVTLAAFTAGLVWAVLPVLSDGYLAPGSSFYLIVLCAISANAVVHGAAYSRVPIVYVTPGLLTACVCLFTSGRFDRIAMGFVILLFLVALVRTARYAERDFRAASRARNEATALARSLKEAHARSLEIADFMREQIRTDELTGLLNRSGFMQELEKRAEERRPLCLMMLDLDGFKSVNDVFGHRTGDMVLMEVASRLRAIPPGDAAIGRIGGDEFAILFDPNGRNETPVQLATRMIASIAIPFAAVDSGSVGISIGITLDERVRADELLTGASVALKEAKAQGRSRFCLFDCALRRRLERARDVERDLLRAISDERIDVHFQPLMGAGGTRLTSLEALLRWSHPKHGNIPAIELVQAAAAAGLSEALLRVILRQSCTMMQALRTMGLEHVVVGMNISPREVAQLPVDEIILGMLHSLDLPPAMLEVEITEETVMDTRDAKARLAALSKAGVRVAIDDFGVGYSTLASLRDLHVDRIKIDRCFVLGLAQSEGDRALVDAILNLGRALGLEVVAEGVENEEDLRALRELGCSVMQGFYFSPPLPRRDAIDWIRRRRLIPLA